MTALRLLETLHGHLGVLAAAALFHPAIVLRKGQALSYRSRWAVVASTALAVLAFGGGLVIYPAYREDVRARLFLKSNRAGFLFETKEHLAFAVVAMALGACVCALVAPSKDRELRRAAALIYGISAAISVIVVLLGSFVTAVHGFGSVR